MVFQNFPQFIVIHTVKGLGIVNKADTEVFLELSCFFDDPADVGNLISGSSAFSDQEATVRTGHGTTDWFQIGKGVHQTVYCHSAYLTYIQSTS